MKTFACGDVIPGCSASFSAPDEDGILAQVVGHAAPWSGHPGVPEGPGTSRRPHEHQAASAPGTGLRRCARGPR